MQLTDLPAHCIGIVDLAVGTVEEASAATFSMRYIIEKVLKANLSSRVRQRCRVRY